MTKNLRPCHYEYRPLNVFYSTVCSCGRPTMDNNEQNTLSIFTYWSIRAVIESLSYNASRKSFCSPAVPSLQESATNNIVVISCWTNKLMDAMRFILTDTRGHINQTRSHSGKSSRRCNLSETTNARDFILATATRFLRASTRLSAERILLKAANTCKRIFHCLLCNMAQQRKSLWSTASAVVLTEHGNSPWSIRC